MTLQVKRRDSMKSESTESCDRGDGLTESERTIKLAFRKNIEYMLPEPGLKIRKGSSSANFRMQGKRYLEQY